ELQEGGGGMVGGRADHVVERPGAHERNLRRRAHQAISVSGTVPHRPLPRLQPNSGLPEFGRFIDWPKSETSDFGWRDREGACDMVEHFHLPPPHPSPASGRGSRPSLSPALLPFRPKRRSIIATIMTPRCRLCPHSHCPRAGASPAPRTRGRV